MAFAKEEIIRELHEGTGTPGGSGTQACVKVTPGSGESLGPDQVYAPTWVTIMPKFIEDERLRIPTRTLVEWGADL